MSQMTAAPASTIPSTAAPPSPALLFDTFNAYQRSAALRAGIELDLFSAIARGATTPAAIARACNAAERGVRILCDYLAILGFITRSSRGEYALTPDSAVFLDRSSPAYAGGMVRFLFNPEISGSFDRLADAARRGGTAVESDGTVAPDHPVWVDFARTMAPMMAMPAERLAELVDPRPARAMKVLDVSASHGLFGLAFARRNPQAQVVATDWKAVLEVAAENARKFGVADRFRTIPGSAFKVDFGGGYDVILLPNFLHHFDPKQCTKLLAKVQAALKPDGRAVTLEFIPNEDRTSPLPAAMFALTMLATTPAGDAYTYDEYDMMHRTAGFARTELQPLPPTMQRVVMGYKT